MSIDYRTLLAPAETVRASDGMMSIVVRSADDLLATRIPDLCPDCDQGDVKHLPYSQTCTHPNAPTIADLLRWGENVAKAVQDDDYGAVRLGDQLLRASAVGLLAALRTEAKQSEAD